MRHKLVYLACISLSLLITQCATIDSLLKSTSQTNSTSKGGAVDAEYQLRSNIVDFALEQQGTRYKYAGRNPNTGFDCSGFTYYAFNEHKIELTPISRIQETEGRKIPLKDAQKGDLIFFRRSKTGSVFHVALVVSNDNDELTVVHSTSSRGVIMENINKSSYWRSKVATACDVISK